MKNKDKLKSKLKNKKTDGPASKKSKNEIHLRSPLIHLRERLRRGSPELPTLEDITHEAAEARGGNVIEIVEILGDNATEIIEIEDNDNINPQLLIPQPLIHPRDRSKQRKELDIYKKNVELDNFMG